VDPSSVCPLSMEMAFGVWSGPSVVWALACWAQRVTHLHLSENLRHSLSLLWAWVVDKVRRSFQL
jgi:hypothetical protein